VTSTPKLVCSLGYDDQPGIIQFWDLLSGEETFLIEHAHSKEIRSLAKFQQESDKFLASGGNDRQIKIWDTQSYQII
jgi:WD40 repeat protein